MTIEDVERFPNAPDFLPQGEPRCRIMKHPIDHARIAKMRKKLADKLTAEALSSHTNHRHTIDVVVRDYMRLLAAKAVEQDRAFWKRRGGRP